MLDNNFDTILIRFWADLRTKDLRGGFCASVASFLHVVYYFYYFIIILSFTCHIYRLYIALMHLRKQFLSFARIDSMIFLAIWCSLLFKNWSDCGISRTKVRKDSVLSNVRLECRYRRSRISRLSRVSFSRLRLLNCCVSMVVFDKTLLVRW